MANFCKISMDVKLDERGKRELSKVLRRFDKSFKHFKENYWTEIKDLYKFFNTSYAGVYDDLKDALHMGKMSSSNKRVSDEIKQIYKRFNMTNDTAGKYLLYRKAKRMSRIANDHNHDSLYQNSSDFREMINGGEISNVNGFKEHWRKLETELENFVNGNPDIQQLDRELKAYTKKKVDSLFLEFPDVMENFVGNNENPLNVIDAIYSRLFRTGSNDNIRKFYEKTLGVDSQKILDSPEGMEIVAHHIMNVWTKSLRLNKRIVSENANEEFIKRLEGKADVVAKVDKDFINSLDPYHPLRKIYNAAYAKAMRDPKAMKILSDKIDSGADPIEALQYALKGTATNAIISNNALLRDSIFRTWTKSHKDLVPNLFALINGNKYEYEKLQDEMNLFGRETGKADTIPFYSANEGNLNFTLANELAKEAKDAKVNVAEEHLQEIMEQFPEHSIVTGNGTLVLNSDLKFSDIENSKEVLGHIVDLTDPNLIVEDAAIIKTIQTFGKSGLLNAIKEGRVNIIPKEKARIIQKYKNELTGFMKPGLARKVNRVFSQLTLFSPVNIPGYILGTQVWGNIGHTMMADPKAFVYWPKFIAALKYAAKGEHMSIEDEDVREIVGQLMYEEGSSIHQMTAENFNMFDENVMKELESGVAKKDEGMFMSAINKVTKGSMKISKLVELISRGAMAYNILDKKRNGKVFVPATANPARVEHLWDFNDHLAAVRLANDTHIDYNNMPKLIKNISAWFPFSSFKFGSAVNMQRQITNTIKAVNDAVRHGGDKRIAATYLGRSALAVMWRAGMAATLWNAAMTTIGAASQEEIDKANHYGITSIFGTMFNHFGFGLDNNFFIPGTGVRPIDWFFRLGQGNQKMDVFSSAETMIPFLNNSWRERGPVNVIAGQLASSASPIIKTPMELLMGGGSIRETGYIKPKDYLSTTETTLSKFTQFLGLSSATNEVLDAMHGYPHQDGQTDAWEVRDALYSLKQQSYKNDPYDAIKQEIKNSMGHMQTNELLENLRKYEYDLKKSGKFSDAQIKDRLRNAVTHSSISYYTKENPALLNQPKILSALQKQNNFIKSIGLDYLLYD